MKQERKQPWPRDEAAKAINAALSRAVIDNEFRDRCLVSKYSAKNAVQEVTKKPIPVEVEISFTTLAELAQLFVLQVPDFVSAGIGAVPANMQQYMRCTLGMDGRQPVWPRKVAAPILNEALRQAAADRSFRDRCLASPASAKKAVQETTSSPIPGEAEIWFMPIEELHRIFIIEMPPFVGDSSHVPPNFDSCIRCCWPVYGPHPTATQSLKAED